MKQDLPLKLSWFCVFSGQTPITDPARIAVGFVLDWSER